MDPRSNDLSNVLGIPHVVSGVHEKELIGKMFFFFFFSRAEIDLKFLILEKVDFKQMLEKCLLGTRKSHVTSYY